jgi:hypothetical protein
MSKDAEKDVNLLRKLAEETNLSAEINEFEDLDVNVMVTGIGRKATDEELKEYLAKDANAEPLNIKAAFSKYSDKE